MVFAIITVGLPFTVLASMVSFANDVTKNNPRGSGYNNTIVHELSNTLKKAVGEVSEVFYTNVGRM